MTIHIEKTTMRNFRSTAGIIVLTTVLVACGGKEEVATSGNNEPVVTLTHEGLLANQNMDAALWFNTSAEADYMFRQCYDLATIKLNAAMNNRRVDGIPAVVLDLDETVLDNSPYQLSIIAANRTYDEGSWAEWVQKASAEALPGALEFTRNCQERGVEVYYVSNRSIDFMNPTITNMQNLGFPNADPDHILLKEDDSDKTTRREFVASHHDVILYCGDNLRDYREDFSDRTVDFGKDHVEERESEMLTEFIIFPNPMYGEWERMYVDDKHEMELEKKSALIERLMSEQEERARSTQQREGGR